MIGGYSDLIAVCAETGDLSPLGALSVKDLIWLRVALHLKRRDELEVTSARMQSTANGISTLLTVLADLRLIQIDSNYYERIAAFNQSPELLRKLRPFDIESLPSSIDARKAEEERRKTLSPVELELELIKDAQKGKPYRPH